MKLRTNKILLAIAVLSIIVLLVQTIYSQVIFRTISGYLTKLGHHGNFVISAAANPFKLTSSYRLSFEEKKQNNLTLNLDVFSPIINRHQNGRIGFLSPNFKINGNAGYFHKQTGLISITNLELSGHYNSLEGIGTTQGGAVLSYVNDADRCDLNGRLEITDLRVMSSGEFSAALRISDIDPFECIEHFDKFAFACRSANFNYRVKSNFKQLRYLYRRKSQIIQCFKSNGFDRHGSSCSGLYKCLNSNHIIEASCNKDKMKFEINISQAKPANETVNIALLNEIDSKTILRTAMFHGSLFNELYMPLNSDSSAISINWDWFHRSKTVKINDNVYFQLPRKIYRSGFKENSIIPLNECGSQKYLEGKLAFVEFDDSGHLSAPNQQKALFEIIRKQSKNNLILIVYMHGWNHDAQKNDDNIGSFCNVLEAAAIMEQQTAHILNRDKRFILGVYLSWRGKLYDDPAPNKSTTFWHRLSAAEAIGKQGTLKNLLLKIAAHLPERHRSQGAANMSTMIISAHSMGAKAIFEAVRDAIDETSDSAAGKRYGDLIVLINPAFSASDFRSIHEAHRLGLRSGTPIVLFSSSADYVTKFLYPLGRTISYPLADYEHTKFSEYVTTAANFREFITHRLSLKSCVDNDVGSLSKNSLLRGIYRIPRIERKSGALFDYKRVRIFSQPDAYNQEPNPDDLLYEIYLKSVNGQTDNQNLPCGTYRREEPTPQYLVNMVIQVDEQIIPDHNEIFTPAFLEYVVRMINFQLKPGRHHNPEF